MSYGCKTMALVTAVRLHGLVQESYRMNNNDGGKRSESIYLLPGRARIRPPSYLMYSGSG